MHLVGFIVSIYHDARSHERQNEGADFRQSVPRIITTAESRIRNASVI